MLALLNEVRRAARLAPLAADPELQAVASAHTEDMIAARFFGHVSPTTGMVDDRLKRAGVIVSIWRRERRTGGHRRRRAPLAHGQPRPPRQHAGGEVHPRRHRRRGPTRNEAGDLVATLVFARRPPPPPTPLTPAVAIDLHLVAAARERQPPRSPSTPVLQRAAGGRHRAADRRRHGARPTRRSPPRTSRSSASRSACTLSRRRGLHRAGPGPGAATSSSRIPSCFQPRHDEDRPRDHDEHVGNAFKIFVLVIAEGGLCSATTTAAPLPPAVVETRAHIG